MVEQEIARPVTVVPSRRIALLALALGSFAIGCTEFVAVGLLPQIAADLQVSQGAVGQLVTLNAIAVAVGAPLLGALFARRPCRPVLVGALVVFATAHLVAAAAPTFVILLLSRLVTGAMFGLFLAVAFAAAARLAAADARAGALALVQAGITSSTALGVPLGMWLAQTAGSAGWRMPFVAIAAIAMAAAAAIAGALPRMAAEGETALLERLGALGRGPVALGIATITVFWAGSFCAFTYIVPLLTESTGLSWQVVVPILLIAGLTSVAGNILGGRGADRALSATLAITAGVTLGGLVLLYFVAEIPLLAVAAILIWQLAAWSFVPAVQARIYELGGDQGEAAVSFSVAAFNVGIVLGAGLGGIAIEASGPRAVVATATVLAAAAFTLTITLNRTRSRH